MNLDLPDGTDSIRCKVKFSGSNVLEGIKECVLSDCVALPVPEPLKCMPHCASNIVSIIEIHDNVEQSAHAIDKEQLIDQDKTS